MNRFLLLTALLLVQFSFAYAQSPALHFWHANKKMVSRNDSPPVKVKVPDDNDVYHSKRLTYLGKPEKKLRNPQKVPNNVSWITHNHKFKRTKLVSMRQVKLNETQGEVEFSIESEGQEKAKKD